MRTTQSPKGTRTPRRLEAQLLGGLTLRYDGRPLPESAFRRRKSLILLLRLLTSPGHRQPVDTMVELLWPEQEARLLGAAEQLRGILGVAVPAGERAEHDQAVQRLRDALGERAFTAAWTAGCALSTEQAAALALSWGPALLPGATA